MTQAIVQAEAGGAKDRIVPALGSWSFTLATEDRKGGAWEICVSVRCGPGPVDLLERVTIGDT